MTEKNELFDEELEAVNGGQITYTWDGTQGTMGLNGYNPYILVDKDRFIAYYNSVMGTMRDPQILAKLREQGIIRLP